MEIRPLTVSILGGKVSLNLSEVLSLDLMRHCQMKTRRGVGVADRAGFENRCAFWYRGFESRPLRFFFIIGLWLVHYLYFGGKIGASSVGAI